MDDKDNERDVNISGTVENDDETALEEAVTVVTFLPSSVRRISSHDTTLTNHSSRVYSNSHRTQVPGSTDNREEDLLLEFEENSRRQQYCTFSDSLVRAPESPAQTTSFEKREEDELSRQTSSRSQPHEPLESIAQRLDDLSLQSSTTSTPQQESCGRGFDDPSDGRLENDTLLRRGGLVDVQRVQVRKTLVQALFTCILNQKTSAVHIREYTTFISCYMLYFIVCAQESLLQKSILDSRKDSLIARISMQVHVLNVM